LDNKPLRTKRKGRIATQILEREPIPFEEFTDEELYNAKGGCLVFDIESFFNYFLIAFRCFNTNKVVYFERGFEDNFNRHKLLWIAHNFCLVGFNSKGFDEPLLWFSMNPDVTIETLKYATNHLIKDNMRPSDIEKMYGFKMGKINHIDLIEVAPLSASLKTYIGRLHASRLQDLPFDSESYLTQDQCAQIKDYCINNDLTGTLLLLNELCPQLALRHELSLVYNQDLRSKSDAQIAEAVISSEVKKLNGYWAKKPQVEYGAAFKYEIPSYITYKTLPLQKMYDVVKNSDFVIRESGKVLIPENIEALTINIGTSYYNLTIGGLHSTESEAAHTADNNTLLLDVDVASFYPQIILNLKLFPKHLTDNFLIAYKALVDRRLGAKSEVKRLKGEIKKLGSSLGELVKDLVKKEYKQLDYELGKAQVITDSIKIVINGGFGKFGSPYSILYSPNLLMSVTMTGQLSLLMLIEMIELVGIPVVSGNTDGIVIKCPKARYNELCSIVKEWEIITNFKTEETRYKGIYARDVNNYFAIKDGEVKVKGCYAERGSALNSVLSKNPKHLICSDAIIKLITENIPIEQTIYECKDIRRYVSLINVKGGGEKDGFYLGKVVRFYYAKNIEGCISYVINGNKVPETDGAKPCMDLPCLFPSDVDYERYVEETNKALYKIGYYKREKQTILF
jgi:hypothetical protein